MNKNKLQELLKMLYAWCTRPSKGDFLHIIAGCLIASAVAILVPKIAIIAFLFSLGIGIGKEFFDKWLYGNFDIADIKWTAFGGLLVEVFIIIKWLI